MDSQGHKTDKELAVYLTAEYLNGFYSGGSKRAVDPEMAKKIVRMWYDAIKAIPEDQ